MQNINSLEIENNSIISGEQLQWTYDLSVYAERLNYDDNDLLYSHIDTEITQQFIGTIDQAIHFTYQYIIDNILYKLYNLNTLDTSIETYSRKAGIYNTLSCDKYNIELQFEAADFLNWIKDFKNTNNVDTITPEIHSELFDTYVSTSRIEITKNKFCTPLLIPDKLLEIIKNI